MRCHTGFTLTEVLVAIALAATALGVLLSSVAFQMMSVKRAESRYQSLVYAAAVLESRLEAGADKQEGVSDRFGEYVYSVDTQVVTADPRVQQVRVAVSRSDGSRATLSAYRLRIRRRSAK